MNYYNEEYVILEPGENLLVGDLVYSILNTPPEDCHQLKEGDMYVNSKVLDSSVNVDTVVMGIVTAYRRQDHESVIKWKLDNLEL